MQIGQQHSDLTASLQEMSELGHGNKVATVGSTSGCGTPVDLQWSLFDLKDVLDDLGVQNLLQVAGDKFELLFGGQFSHCRWD